MMNHSRLRLLLFAIAFSGFHASAQELAGKTFVAGNGATCKEMSDGGCMIYYYRVLEFSADSVRVSHRTDANCTHPEREAMYEHLHDKLTKSYKWTASDGIVTLEHCPEFEHLSLKDGYLMGTLTTEYETRELLFKEEN